MSRTSILSGAGSDTRVLAISKGQLEAEIYAVWPGLLWRVAARDPALLANLDPNCPNQTKLQRELIIASRNESEALDSSENKEYDDRLEHFLHRKTNCPK